MTDADGYKLCAEAVDEIVRKNLYVFFLGRVLFEDNAGI